MDSEFTSFPLSFFDEYAEGQRSELLIVCGYDIKICSSRSCVGCIDIVMQVVIHNTSRNDWRVGDGSTF